MLSGAWSNEAINKALVAIDEKQIVLKGPDDVYEVSSSAMPLEKIQAAKDKLYLKYEDVSALLDEYVGYKNDITKNISILNKFTDIRNNAMWYYTDVMEAANTHLANSAKTRPSLYSTPEPNV